MQPAMPRPKSRGNTITFAKLNGRLKIADAAPVMRAANINGAKIRVICRNCLVRRSTKILTKMTVVMAASVNARMTVFPASNIMIGAPVAFGAID